MYEKESPIDFLERWEEWRNRLKAISQKTLHASSENDYHGLSPETNPPTFDRSAPENGLV